MIRKRNNKRVLYESIMRDVAKVVKRHLNEETSFIDPVLELTKLPDIYKDKAELMSVENDESGTTIEIGINVDYEFWWSVYIEKSSENTWNVYAYHCIEGLETEICDEFNLTYDEIKEKVIDVIKDSILNPEPYEEYKYDSEDDY